MKRNVPSLLAISMLALLVSNAACAETAGLPGDHGRPGDGIPPPPQEPPAGALNHQPAAPDIDLAVKVAQEIAKGCQQYGLSVAVLNAAGEPILMYVSKSSSPGHGYMAVRKAYSAIVFKEPSSALKAKVTQDPDAAARFKADPNLVAYPGGFLWKVGDTIIGAIGVAGAYAGNHESLDEQCGLAGLAKIKMQPK